MARVLGVLAAVAFLQPSAGLAQADTLPPLCFGDCETSGTVDVSDLVLLVNIALGSAPVTACAGIVDPPGIDDLLRAVNTSLSHCPVSITYRLTDASTIIVSDGSGFPAPTPQPLAGQFTVTVSTDLMPNTLIGLTIKRVSFNATGVAVNEGELTSNPNCSYPQPDLGYGCITANTINPPPVTYASAFLSINGQFSELVGGGPFEGNPYLPPYDGSTPPPPFNHLTLCSAYPFCEDIRSGAAAGYVLTLFAAPDGYATPSPTPTTTPVLTCTATWTFVPLPTWTPSVSATPTRTCGSPPSPPICPIGEGAACDDQQCLIGCGCGTVTATPTPTRTCGQQSACEPDCPCVSGHSPTQTPLCHATPAPIPTPPQCSGCVPEQACFLTVGGVEVPGVCGEPFIVNGQCHRACGPEPAACSGDACDSGNLCATSGTNTVIRGYCRECHCVPVECGDVEYVGGCCDFEGRRPCYPLVHGADAAGCRHTDLGLPRGCSGSGISCNPATGLCEQR